MHSGEAWGVANVAVEIGQILSCNNQKVDDFNTLVMEFFNLAKGNMLQKGTVLTWNVWFDAPTLVDQTEWKNHAEFWRQSIETAHGSPDGPGRPTRYFNGTPFQPIVRVIETEWEKIKAWLKQYYGISLPDSAPTDWVGPPL